MTDLPHDPDDDFAVPAPDAASDGAERARAKGFAELIDKVVAGRTPAAVPAEDQALLEVATAIRATMRPIELGSNRRSAIVEAALAMAIDRKGGRVSGASGALPIPITAAPRRRLARVAPWLVAATTSLAAAAALVLWMRDRRPAPAPAPTTAAVAPLPLEERSRPADALIGAIDRAGAGAALDRIDAIYADRLGGFRDRTMQGGRR